MPNLEIYNFKDSPNILPKELLSLLSEYIAKSSSTGCNNTDYRTLYMNIRNFKFKEI